MTKSQLSNGDGYNQLSFNCFLLLFYAVSYADIPPLIGPGIELSATQGTLIDCSGCAAVVVEIVRQLPEAAYIGEIGIIGNDHGRYVSPNISIEIDL